MGPKTACLCQPEALNLDLPEVQVKHWHNNLFLEQAEDMNLPTLTRACKSTEMSFAHTITPSVYMHELLAWKPATPYQICIQATITQQARTFALDALTSNSYFVCFICLHSRLGEVQM